jgi:hypothetical protein
MTPDERADMIADATAEYLADLVELERAGCGPELVEWIAALPDPATDGLDCGQGHGI